MAIARYPKVALRTLAQRLGVDDEHVERRMARWEQDQHRRKQELVRAKRKQELTCKGHGQSKTEDGDEASRKLLMVDTKEDHGRELPTQLPLRDLVGAPESDKHSQSSSGIKLI
ncbi:hypothetical protein LTR66_008416 [Elasticomyces elasticus]|nr:hypothetical protein LTR50_007132 [Elasticomyces elasticus]KAK4984684.1 hypothetical protein LTR66_008416 [Elasticomyces elasticus]